jgi:type IV pilus assembly protein PilE
MVEVLIVVAIIGILAAIAYPSYVNYIDRGRVMEATSNLADLRVKMEQAFQDNRTYDAVGPCAAPIPNSKYFSYTCVTALGPPSTFTITANSLSGPAFQFTVNHNNVRRTEMYKGTAVGLNCWILKQGETC